MNPAASSAGSPDDPLPAMNRLFINALLALAEAGSAEQACRLAAQGYAVLRHGQAREAERLNALLHSLTRHPSVVLPRETGATHA